MTKPDSDSKSGRHGWVRMKSNEYAMKAPIRSSGCSAVGQDLVEPVAEAHRVVVGRRGEDGVLAREIAVEGSPRHAGRLCDLLHPESLDAAPADEAECGGEEALFGGIERSYGHAERVEPPGLALSDLVKCRGHYLHILDTLCPLLSDMRVRGRPREECSRW